METKPVLQPSQQQQQPVSSFPSAQVRPSPSMTAPSDLLGLSISSPVHVAPQPIPIGGGVSVPQQPRPIHPGHPQHQHQPVPPPGSLPSSYTLRRRASESQPVGSPGRMLSGLEKKKQGGGSGGGPAGGIGMARRASEVTRTVRKGSNPPPALFDFRSTDAASPVPTTGSLPATSHMPVVLHPGDGEDGEILGEEADALNRSDKGADGAGEAGKPRRRRSSNIFRCESCQKIYRHPSCLVKHRWQHSPAWQESSKFLVSKHQQVQMLEAATILVHLQPGSLPEDKSLWPAAISPQSHPMPSISFNDSRSISRQGTALQLAQAQRAQNQAIAQQRVAAATGPQQQQQQLAAAQGLRQPSPGSASQGSGEETSVEGGSSPPSSLEEGEDDEDEDDGDNVLAEDGDLEMDFGEDDAPRRKVVRPKPKPMPQPPQPAAPSLGANRRPSFGSVTAVMGNLALGSLPKSSSPLTQQPALPLNHGVFGGGGGGYQSGSSYSPHYQTMNSFGGAVAPSPTFAPSSLLSRSLSGPASYGAQASYSPYSTSPALPHPSSSLRGGGSSFDDDVAGGLAGSPFALGGGSRFLSHVVVEEDEDEDDFAPAGADKRMQQPQQQQPLQRSGKEGSGEREEVFGLDDMEM